MIQKKYFFILVLLLGNLAFSQQHGNSLLDTLSGKDFEYLKNNFESSLNDRAKSKIYASALLGKARADKHNYMQLALAYRANAIIVERPLRLFYADSMIHNAVLAKNDELIGTSYMSKGAIHYERLEHLKALDNYLLADKYISKLGNAVLTYKLKYCISQIKYHLGFYHEAITLLNECVNYYVDENDRAYLSSLHALGLCYTRIGKHRSATETNQMGIDQGHLIDNVEMQFYFIHSEGINQYYSGNFDEAIKKLNKALNDVTYVKDYANEAVAYFYIGQSYWSLKQYETALNYFKKVDHIFQKKNYMLPDLRRGYENLIEYYTHKKNTQLQLFYINQLLKVDRLLADDYKHILTKIVKEYDTKELLNAKNEIEGTILFTRIAAGVTLVLMGIIIVYLIQKNKRNKKLFEELMKRDTANRPFSSDNNIIEETELEVPEIIEVDSNEKPARKISPEIEEAIVKKLDKFELNKRYLEKDMTVRKMAVILNTNDKYVTKIIAKHRGKGTIEYINELKLDYIIEMLKTDSRYRNYTHKALGDEAGFRTTQSFTRAFKSHTGITPTYFSYKLKKSATTDSSN